MGLFDRFKSDKLDEVEVDLNKRNFVYLNHLIQNAENDITLDSDITLEDGEEDYFKKGIEIKKDLVINGKGHAIDASGKGIFFLLKTSKTSIHFRNVVFRNAFIKGKKYSIQGEKNVAVKFSDCIFEDNELPINIFGEGYLSDCTFKNNKIGVILHRKTEIRECGFEGNGIGIQNIEGDGSVVNCNFKNNEIGISSSGEQQICDSTFEDDNHCISLSNGKFNIRSCNFKNNRSVLQGSGKIELDDCEFSQNKSCGEIHAIPSRFNDCRFSDNGTLHLNGISYFTGCLFENNSSRYDGGAIYNKSRCEIKECTFTGNHAEKLGGAIYNDFASSVSVHDSCFKDNRAQSGGAIYNMAKPKTAWDSATNSKFGDGIVKFQNQGNRYSGNICKNKDGKDIENTLYDTSNLIAF